jgi:hypothetical protein
MSAMPHKADVESEQRHLSRRAHERHFAPQKGSEDHREVGRRPAASVVILLPIS